MKTYFIDLFKYHAWANRELISAIQINNIKDRAIIKILSHLLLAEMTWLQRLKSEQYDNEFWKELSLESCNKLSTQNSANIQAYINSLPENDFENLIKYKNSKGIEFTNTIREILTHLSHHTSYHRGQIAKEMRTLGKEPVNTDYIIYLRKFL